MPRANELRKLLVSLDISQHNTLVSFALKRSTIFRGQYKFNECYLWNVTGAVQLRILLTG